MKARLLLSMVVLIAGGCANEEIKCGDPQTFIDQINESQKYYVKEQVVAEPRKIGGAAIIDAHHSHVLTVKKDENKKEKDSWLLQNQHLLVK